MLKIILNRVLYFLPTMFIISLVAFFLSKASPGSPIDHLLPQEEMPGSQFAVDYYKKEYTRLAKERHLDSPLFYFGIQPAAYPDTFYRIVLEAEQVLAKKLIGQYGNWPAISAYIQSINDLETAFFNWPDTLAPDDRIRFQRTLGDLQSAYHDENIDFHQKQLKDILSSHSHTILKNRLFPILQQHENAYHNVKANTTLGRLYRPRFRWHGFDNQYHTWITGLLTGDFGTSIRDGRPVFDKIKIAAWWTLCINIPAIGIAFLLAVPLGVFTGRRAGSAADRRLSFFLFLLYSIPAFWMAMMLVLFFTTPAYGMHWFASVGLGELPPDAPFIDRLLERASHLVLPIFCMTYAALAFITRQVRGGMVHVLQEEYIKTARAKGLDRQRVVWHHAFHNALFPLITLVAVVFPATLAGSVVVEVIFNIPGMGRLMFDSILGKDWAVVFVVLFIIAVLNMVGNLVADVLYRVADPRVSG